ncbi:MAG: UvrD-helicase domain-containing protein, partial [Defluviitaleaceae bacterium]|nr:UvrD-helicase domain-containing protein [Defluviitaleaceae bacterium]
ENSCEEKKCDENSRDENPNCELEKIYIGRHSLFDERAQNFLVYDWRAPISSLYYDFGTGAASFKIPTTGAEIFGEIRLKRQFQIEKGELIYLFDNDIAIEDDILRLELSKASEARIKTIINTIQADQNTAIRAESGDILVYGPAGCGKTSVGLHRLAYLLYRHRNSLSSAKVRIFSPNEVFSSYIAGIIPDLGEEDVQTLDFSMLLAKQKKFRSPFEMIEFLNAHPNEIRSWWIREKFSAKFLDELEEIISSYEPVFENVVFYDDILCNAERLKSLYQDRTSQGTLATKTERVISYVSRCFSDYFASHKKKITEIFNDISDENFSDGIIRAKFEEEKNIALADIRNRSFPRAQKIFDRVLKKYARSQQRQIVANENATSQNSAFSHEEKERASQNCAFSHDETHATNHKFQTRDSSDESTSFQKNNWEKNYFYAREVTRSEILFFEDALVNFYIDLLTGRIPPEKNVKHILIDEAQDLSVLHHRVLKKLFSSSNFTVLADANQAIFPDININEIDALKALYPRANAFGLTKSYRSTCEIMKFAAKILGCDEPDSFLRSGEPPTIISGEPVAEILKILGGLSSEYNTVGILFASNNEAKNFYTAFKKNFPKNNAPRPLKFISDDGGSFERGIMIMAATFAKGLEFDVVIGVGCCAASIFGDLSRGSHDVTKSFSEQEKKLLYLICTRALHKLFLIN